MKHAMKQSLVHFTRKTITIDELEALSPKTTSYETFATEILALEKENILQMIKSKGRNGRSPSLAHHYRIQKHLLQRTFHQELQQYRLLFSDAINLDAYFTLDQSVWKKDLPFLEKLNAYIQANGFPTEKVPAPERSFELVGDEKWIEQGGSEVLQRVDVWDAMQIFPVSDPLMLAINPNKVAAHHHFHLIVENKTTYQALVPVLVQSAFSTLVYGVGNKIAKSMENFYDQFPVDGAHVFFYFGDLDRSGITIWHSLQQRVRTIPAHPFYEQCLRKEEAYGKTNQRPNQTALEQFLQAFSKKEQQQIQELLDKGAYYPQEVLKTKELQHILLASDWELAVQGEERRHGND